MAQFPSSWRKLFHSLALSIGLVVGGHALTSVTSDFTAAAAEITEEATSLVQEEVPSGANQKNVWDQLPELLKTKEGQEKIFKAASVDPIRAFKMGYKLQELGGQDIARPVRLAACSQQLVRQIAEYPQYGLAFFNKYIDSPVAEEILDIVIPKLPIKILDELDKLKPELYGMDEGRIKKLREESAHKIVDRNQESVKKTPCRFMRTSFGSAYARKVLALAPDAIFYLKQEQIKHIFSKGQEAERKEVESKAQKLLEHRIKSKDENSIGDLIQILNDHDRDPPRVRADILSRYSAEDLFFVISKSNDNAAHRAAYSSLHDMMHAMMEKEGITPDQLLNRASLRDNIDDFTNTVSKSGGLDKFLKAGKSPDEQKKATKTMITSLMNGYIERTVRNSNLNPDKPALDLALCAGDLHSPLGTSIILLDFMSKAHSDVAQTAALDTLANLYINTSDPITRTMIGATVSTYYAMAEDAAVPHKFFTEKEHITQKYPVEIPKVIPEEKLFKDGKCLVWMRYFENSEKDKDATDTYNQMLQHYRSSGKKKNGWVVEERDDYTLISNKLNPAREIVIVSNKPNDKDLFARNIKTRFFLHDKPNVTVIRGHNGRVDDISDSDKPSGFGIVGVCNGYWETNAIRKSFQNTPVFTTDGVGRMVINDTVLSENLEAARDKGSIDLKETWKRVEKTYKGEGLDAYVPPHKNAFSIMLNNLDRFLLEPVSTPAPPAAPTASILPSPRQG